MNEAEIRARDAFRDHFGRDPAGVSFAPGRVNLIGEHVDYNEGLVLPMGLEQGTGVAWAPRDDRKAQVWAADYEEHDRFDVDGVRASSSVDWRQYVRGVFAMLPAQGIAVHGVDLVIAGTLPRGAGLSSSASLTVATARAIAAAQGSRAPVLEIARAAQAAERRFAGVRCGIMDPLASAAARPGHATLIDCRSLAVWAIRLPAEWRVLIIESGIERALADGEYNARRSQCEAAAVALGVASLRDASLATIEAARELDPTLRRRARHVVGEIARTAACAQAMRKGDLATFGRLLREGQRSLREDFETSLPEIDRLVATLDEAVGPEGGARMTGAGFGGAIVVVCHRSREPIVARVLAEMPAKVISSCRIWNLS